VRVISSGKIKEKTGEIMAKTIVAVEQIENSILNLRG